MKRFIELSELMDKYVIGKQPGPNEIPGYNEPSQLIREWREALAKLKESK